MVSIKSIRYKNFFNIADQSISLNGQGLVMVTGKNGSGKSTMYIEGVLYALYGETFRYGSKPGDSIVREYKEKGEDSFVEAVIDVDGEEYVIRRIRKAASNPKGVSLYKDGKDISRGTTDETQRLIAQLIGMSSHTFKQSVIFSSEMLKFPVLPDSQKKEVFDELLQLGCFEPALKKTKERIKEIKSTKSQLETEVKGLEQSIAETSDTLSRLKLQSEQWEAGKESRLSSRKELEEAALEYLNEAKRVKEKITAPKESIPYATKLAEAILILAEERRRLNPQFPFEKELIECNHEIEKLSGLAKETTCPTCNQPIRSEVDLDGIERRIVVLKEKRDGYIREKETHTNSAKIAAQGLADAEQVVERMRQKLKLLQDAESEYKSQLRLASAEIDLREGEYLSAVKLREAEEGHENPFEISLQTHSADVVKWTERLSTAKQTLNSIYSSLRDELLLEETFGSKGAKLLMVSAALPLLNKEAARVRALMGTSLDVAFELRDSQEAYAGSLVVSVKNPHGSPSYQGNSSGEHGRVDIIILLSLLSLAASRGRKAFSQCFFDEVFEHLDREGEAAVMAVLKEISLTKDSIFVISHSAEELGGQCNRVVVVDSGKIS